MQITGPLGGVTTLSYDGSGNLPSVTDPLSRQRSWTYDSHNNLLTATDGNGHKTTFTYNAMDEVTSVTGASGGKATFSYDAAGNLASGPTRAATCRGRTRRRSPPPTPTTGSACSAWGTRCPEAAAKWPLGIDQGMRDGGLSMLGQRVGRAPARLVLAWPGYPHHLPRPGSAWRREPAKFSSHPAAGTDAA